MEPAEVVVIGNVGIDTCVYGFENAAGHESRFTRNVDNIGQAGGYTARGFARLGRRTAFIGHVGQDYGGQWIKNTFSTDNIDIRALGVDPAGTARSVNLMFPDGRRQNFYDGKGHMDYLPDLDLCRKVLRGARLAHFHLADWARRLLPIAREEGATISCDLQDVCAFEDPYRQDFIEQSDILFFSEVNVPHPKEFMDYCFKHGRANVLIAGMGAMGCMLGLRNGISCYDPIDLPKAVVDTNGAGDALATGFLNSYLFDDFKAEEAIIRGQYAARHACTLTADSDHLITAGELERYWADHKATENRKTH